MTNKELGDKVGLNLFGVDRTSKSYTGMRWNGEKVNCGDFFLYFNGYHAMQVSVGLANGEFKATCCYINAANHCRRIAVYSLKRFLKKASRRDHILIRFSNSENDDQYNRFCDFLHANKIDRYSQGHIDKARSEHIGTLLGGLFRTFRKEQIENKQKAKVV